MNSQAVKKNNQNKLKEQNALLPTVHRSVIEPGRMERINVGTFKIKGVPPQFDLEVEPIADSSKDVVCKPMELVDLSDMSYELVYSCQNFSDRRVKVSFKWKGGQKPTHTMTRRINNIRPSDS